MAFTSVDGKFMNDPTYDAGEVRRAEGATFAGNGTDPFAVRGGIALHSSTSLGVTVDGSDVVTVQPGSAVIPGNYPLSSSGVGPYAAAIATAQTNALVARDGTNPRIDLVIFRALDDDVVVAHGAQHFILDIIEGTPSATPSAPELPALSVELARITVPQSGGGAATVDLTNRTFACAVGGTLLVTTFSKLPAAAPPRQEARALDTGIKYAWSGSAWVSERTQTSYTPVMTNTAGGFSQGNGTVVGTYQINDGWADHTIVWTVGSTTSGGTAGGSYTFTLGTTAAAQNAFHPVGQVTIHDVGSQAKVYTVVQASTTTVSAADPANVGGNPFGPTVPFALNTGDIVTMQFRVRV